MSTPEKLRERLRIAKEAAEAAEAAITDEDRAEMEKRELDRAVEAMRAKEKTPYEKLIESWGESTRGKMPTPREFLTKLVVSILTHLKWPTTTHSLSEVKESGDQIECMVLVPLRDGDRKTTARFLLEAYHQGGGSDAWIVTCYDVQRLPVRLADEISVGKVADAAIRVMERSLASP